MKFFVFLLFVTKTCTSINHILLTKLVHEYSKCLVWYDEITKGLDFVIGSRFVILDAMCDGCAHGCDL
jgi:hypothetical protein